MLHVQARANYLTYNSFSIVCTYLYTTPQQVFHETSTYAKQSKRLDIDRRRQIGGRKI